MIRFTLALLLLIAFAASADARTPAQRRAARQTARQIQRQQIRHHQQNILLVPSSTIIAPQGFYGPAIVPPQTIIIR